MNEKLRSIFFFWQNRESYVKRRQKVEDEEWRQIFLRIMRANLTEGTEFNIVTLPRDEYGRSSFDIIHDPADELTPMIWEYVKWSLEEYKNQ